MKSTLMVPLITAIIVLATHSITTSAATFQCDELKTVVAAAKNHFDGLATTVRERETAADLAATAGVSIEEFGLSTGYEKVTYAVAQPLSGAHDCEILDAKMLDEEIDLRQTAFNCSYPGLQAIPDTLRNELEICLKLSIDEESDSDSLTIWVDRVDSGEGYSSTAVEVQANAVQGLSLGVVKTVCLNRSDAGCDSED